MDAGGKKREKIPGEGKAAWRSVEHREQRKKEMAAASARSKAARTCASDYWSNQFINHGGEATYIPDQLCRCPQCLEDNPDSVVETPDGPMTIMDGGRAWPRQAAAVIGEVQMVVRFEEDKDGKRPLAITIPATGCHFECRQIQLAPKDNSVPRWKPRRHRAGDEAWCGERGCWRRRLLSGDDTVQAREVRVRQGRKRFVVGFEESTVSLATLADEQVYAVYSQQVDDPELLAELNGICWHGETSGLLDVFPEAGHASVKRELP